MFFALLVTSAFAQDQPYKEVSIASPTAASLGKYADIPVNYHTGIPRISIPIYSVKEGSLELPISLSVEKQANLEKALNIVVNAKVSRPSVCNAADVILVDEAIAPSFLKQLQPRFSLHQVEVFAEPEAFRLMKGYSHLHKAAPSDFGREFLSLKCAIKVVKGMEEALAHIQQYSTRHSEAIVSDNKKQCERFLKDVDAAAVYANASTRFTDGEEFGLEAEIGISTQKLHARGPFALEKPVTEKWIITGNGQVR